MTKGKLDKRINEVKMKLKQGLGGRELQRNALATVRWYSAVMACRHGGNPARGRFWQGGGRERVCEKRKEQTKLGV